jgi:carbon monoxide dehydrogenase subunit G
MRRVKNATSTILAAVFAIGVMAVACFAASEFEGAWKVTDTEGKPFEITLSGDGTATASRGEGMVGTWKQEGNTAVITWKTGWTTKITKDGEHYKKTAFGKGQPLDGPPANSSDAEKVK